MLKKYFNDLTIYFSYLHFSFLSGRKCYHNTLVVGVTISTPWLEAVACYYLNTSANKADSHGLTRAGKDGADFTKALHVFGYGAAFTSDSYSKKPELLLLLFSFFYFTHYEKEIRSWEPGSRGDRRMLRYQPMASTAVRPPRQTSDIPRLFIGFLRLCVLRFGSVCLFVCLLLCLFVCLSLPA